MATVPTPFDATAAQKLTATQWDAQVRDVFLFLMNPPLCDLAMNTGLLHANGTATLETYDTESADTDAMHSTVSNPSRIIFNTSGRFHLSAYVFMPQIPTTYSTYTVNLRLNSGGSSAGGTSIRSFSYGTPGGAPAQSVTHLSRVCTAGDYIEVFVTQTSGSSRTTDASLGIFANGFQARWVSVT